MSTVTNPFIVVYELRSDKPEAKKSSSALSSKSEDFAEDLDTSSPTSKASASKAHFPIWSVMEPYIKTFLPLQLEQPAKQKHPLFQNNVFYPLINQIKVDFIYASDPRAKASRHWSKWFQNPYFHIFIVQCDNADEYKKTVKPALKEWIRDLNEKEYEFAIVYIPNETTFLQKLSLFNVFEKLKSDFNDKKDRVIKIANYKTKREDYNDLIAKIKDGILLEFVRRCSKYDEEVKKFEDNRKIPGWQYCHYFIVKEGLAFTLEQFGLHVNSLGTYNELKSFMASYEVKFDTFIDESDFSIPKILDPYGKDYWTKIYESKVSEFDFLNYVFARQINLFFALNSPDESAKHALHYIPYMVARMEDNMIHRTQHVKFTAPPAAIKSQPSTPMHSPQPSSPVIGDPVSGIKKLLKKKSQTSSSASDLMVEISIEDAKEKKHKRAQSASVIPNIAEENVDELSFEGSPDVTIAPPTPEGAGVNRGLAKVASFHFSKYGESELKKYIFIHAWGFCSAICVVEACQKKAFEVDPDTLKSLCRVLGDLYSFARFQLQLLCRLFGLQVLWENFQVVQNEMNKEERSFKELKLASSLLEPGNRESLLVFTSNYDNAIRLKEAIISQEEYDKLDLEILSAATKVYANGSRGRFKTLASSEIASIRFRQEKYVEAMQHLKEYLDVTVKDKWTILELDARIKLAETYRMIGNNPEYISHVLLILGSQELPANRYNFYQDQIQHVSTRVSKGTAFTIDSKFINVAVTKPIKNECPTEVGSDVSLEVTIAYALHGNLKVDSLALVFANEDEVDELTIKSAPFTITSSNQVVAATEKVTQIGRFYLARAELEIGNMIFHVPFTIPEPPIPAFQPYVITKESGQTDLLAPPKKEEKPAANTTTEKKEQKKMQQTGTETNSGSTPGSSAPATPTPSSSPEPRFWIIVNKTKSTLAMEIIHHECLIVEREQIIQFDISINDDSLTSGTLKIKPESGLTIMPLKNPLLKVIPSSSTLLERVKEFSLINGDTVVLPKCDKNEKVTFQLPVKASHNQGGGNSAVYMIDTEIEYKKTTGETFKQKRSFSVVFFTPVIHFFYPKVLKDNHSLLQVVLECTTPVPLRITDYNLKVAEPHLVELKEDFNRAVYFSDTNNVLMPDETISFVFKVLHKDISYKDSLHATLEVQYVPLTSQEKNIEYLEETMNQSQTNNLVAPLKYEVPFAWKNPSKLMYRIEAGFNGDFEQKQDRALTMGTFCPLNVKIQKLSNENQAHNIYWYEVEYDTNFWMMTGPKKKKFHFDENNEISFHCHMVPITTGFITMPSILLHVLSDENQNYENSVLSEDEVEMVFHNDTAFFESSGNRVMVLPSKEDHASPLCPLTAGDPGDAVELQIEEDDNLDSAKRRSNNELSAISNKSKKATGSAKESLHPVVPPIAIVGFSNTITSSTTGNRTRGSTTQSILGSIRGGNRAAGNTTSYNPYSSVENAKSLFGLLRGATSKRMSGSGVSSLFKRNLGSRNTQLGGEVVGDDDDLESVMDDDEEDYDNVLLTARGQKPNEKTAQNGNQGTSNTTTTNSKQK